MQEKGKKWKKVLVWGYKKIVRINFVGEGRGKKRLKILMEGSHRRKKSNAK